LEPFHQLQTAVALAPSSENDTCGVPLANVPDKLMGKAHVARFPDIVAELACTTRLGPDQTAIALVPSLESDTCGYGFGDAFTDKLIGVLQIAAPPDIVADAD
jgi:hypothetical protein